MSLGLTYAQVFELTMNDVDLIIFFITDQQETNTYLFISSIVVVTGHQEQRAIRVQRM